MFQKQFVILLFLWFAILPVNARPVADSSTNNGYSNSSSLINQMVEQNFADPSIFFGQSLSQLLDATNNIGQGSNIGQTILSWFKQMFVGYLPDVVSSLSNVVKSFFLNPNLAQITANSASSGDLSFLLSGLLHIIYGIAFDLLFVLFVLAIWQYWTKASWHGNISAMSAIGRLICTLGIVVGWPTIYSFEVELTNEMISAIFANGADQLHLFDMVMANMFNVGAYSGLLGALMMSQPVALGVAQLGGVVSVLAMLILCILAIILIYELVYLILLKAMQMALLTAQYVFAPIFLIFFATPSTEKIATGYIRTFAETSLWSFIWIGLLKVLVILMYADFNPCSKIITAIGVLQLMMRVPEFLGRFKISSAASFVNPASFTTNLRKNATEYAQKVGSYASQFASTFSGVFKSANTSQAFSGASNNMSADFSFGTAGGSSSAPPSSTFSNSQAKQNNTSDKNMSISNTSLPTNTQPVANSKSSPNIQLPSNSNVAYANTDINQPANTPTSDNGRKIASETKSARDVHFDRKYIPHRKNLPRGKDIFIRHGRGGVPGESNIIDFPATKQTSHGVPTSAAALLDNNSLSSSHSVSSETTSVVSNSGTSVIGNTDTDIFDIISSNARPANSSYPRSISFRAASLLGTLPKLDLASDRSSLATNQNHTVGNRLLVQKAGMHPGDGTAAMLVNRQQFALPIFARNLMPDRTHDGWARPNNRGEQQSAHDKNRSERNSKVDNNLKTNGSNFSAGNSAISYAKKNSNNRDHSYAFALLRSASKTKTRHFDNKQGTARSSLLNEYRISSGALPRQNRAVIDHYVSAQNLHKHYNNRNVQDNSYTQQHKTSLYYQTPTYPNAQRPHYRNSRSIYLPLSTNHRSAFYSGINYSTEPCFRSYYG